MISFKRIILSLILIGSGCLSIQGQFLWSVQFDPFLDNREYENPYQRSQSIMGMWLRPEVGYRFADLHTLKGGVGMMANFGSPNFIDRFDLRAYYQFENKMFKLNVGAFGKEGIVSDYPAIMLYDSILYHRPTMTGLFWQYKSRYGKADVWVDWTGSQSQTQRESFLIGTTGKWQYKPFVAGWEFMLYHYAFTSGDHDNQRLVDNGLLHLWAGVDFSKKWVLDILTLKAGYMQEFSRIRSETQWATPKGFLLEFQLDWQGIGVKNNFYIGDGQYAFYEADQHPYAGPKAYWGDPYYHNPLYNRTDLYIYLIRHPRVSAYFDWSMHYAANVLSHQQQFIVKVYIDQDIKKDKIGYSDFVWGKIFRK